MRTLKISFVCLAFCLFWTLLSNAQQSEASELTEGNASMRELDWDTYVDKVHGAWLGKMIGVTFGAPWEFRYQNTPIGFDITDWALSQTRMKDYRQRAINKPGKRKLITREADNQKVAINDFVIDSEREHPSFGIPDN